jgi:ubiquinone/menaquinone biosynthesis C-methylase UbiE
MKLIRSAFLLCLAGAFACAEDRPKMKEFGSQEITVDDFRASGYILDIGGGGEGIIGRMKPAQVVAIDLYKNELMEAPPGPLKIVMDATDLKFLDSTFDTVTAFYSLMYMKPEVQKKVFAEAFRVLKSGGRWLIWDAAIPAPTAEDRDTKGPVFRFVFHLPQESVRTGYGTLWPEHPLDVAWYRSLAESAGFRVADLKEQDGTFGTFSMELLKL